MIKNYKITDKITLYNEDCMNVMKTLQDKSFDLAIIDPPYWDDNECVGTIRTTGNKQETLALGGKPSVEFFSELKRISKHQIIFGANNFGYSFKGFIVWDKTNIPDEFTLSKCEIASVSESLSKVAKIFRCSSASKNGEKRFHPTSKPIDLYRWILMKYAKEGWKILDTHLGSGSSAIASHDLDFEFVGIEIDDNYFNKAVKRIKTHISQLKMF
jgi:site-specific DNA-methyltransferase (adenine-specific)